MKDWVHNKSQDFITKDPQSLIEILETYLFPYTVINNACIYIKGNSQLDKSQVQLIKKISRNIAVKSIQRMESVVKTICNALVCTN